MSKRKYLEKDFQTDFNLWVRNRWEGCSVFELKVSNTSSIPFSDVQEHQVDSLLAVDGGSGLAYKISDESSGYKPFDSFFLVSMSGYIVVMFRANERGQEEFFMIRIRGWLKEREESNRKSLTEERAREIGRRFFL